MLTGRISRNSHPVHSVPVADDKVRGKYRCELAGRLLAAAAELHAALATAGTCVLYHKPSCHDWAKGKDRTTLLRVN